MTIDARIAKIHALGELPRAVGPKVAAAVERETLAQIARGTDPTGKPWPLTRDGERPLQHAGSALSVSFIGGAVVMSLEGPEALHGTGKARGHVLRRILPRGGLPAPLSRVISETIDAERTKIMGGT